MGTRQPDAGMTGDKPCQEEMQSLKSETKLVVEAFLRRTMLKDEASKVGHVGRYYHDSKKFISKTPEGQDANVTVKTHVRRKSHQKGTLEREGEENKRSLKRAEGREHHIDWDSTDEEIARAEEKKHGFKTTIKKLIRRQKKSPSDSDKKSKDSLDLLEDHGLVKSTKAESKANSLKWQRGATPLLACATGSTESETPFARESAAGEGGKHKKNSSQKFRNPFKKHSHGKAEDLTPERDQESEPSSPRPTTLPLMTNYLNTMDDGSGKNNKAEFYSKVAQKLDEIAQTTIDRLTPSLENADQEIKNNNFHQTDKEKMIEKIVLLLQQQGDGINEKIKEDPVLQRTVSRMSYRSFSQLVKVFTGNVEEQHRDPTTSPELTKIALTMELTRRVAGISSHPVQQLMGYSMQYMDTFVPWLQENGGWTMVLPQDDVSEHQID